jgi:L-asparaginase II
MEQWEPLVEIIRGPLVESVHYGALAVVNDGGELLFGLGDIERICYLRSSSKPFQTIPLVEQDGVEKFGFTPKELAITCASHQGTDDHVETLRKMHEKVGIGIEHLLCGIHPAGDRKTALEMYKRGEEPDQYRHNCSGKHTGILAQCKLAGYPLEDYTNVNHPVQQQILRKFGEMVDVPLDEIAVGIDGCSVPVFGVALRKAAYGYARLCNPVSLEAKLAESCNTITSAMMSHPEMISGPDHTLDTELMRAGHGKLISKGGADGYQAIGIMPGVVGDRGIGITFKVVDGDASGRARNAVSVALLQSLGVLTSTELESLTEFGPRPMYNAAGLTVGQIRIAFSLPKGI